MAKKKIESFGFKPGHRFGRKYEVVEPLGAGWEGEVYLLKELSTGIERAGKFFFPERNLRNRTLRFHAKKLHKLRHCDILIKYNTMEETDFDGQKVSFLVSEYVEGELLSDFLAGRRGKRITPFEGLHLLYALARGLECIHDHKEYHGDLHTENVIVTRFGLGFDLKLIDMFHWKAATMENISDDVVDMLRIYYDATGGSKTYKRQPQEIKDIVKGMKSRLIKKKFKTARHLRIYLEKMHFDSLLG